MYEFLRGTIADKTPSTLILEVNGVGYLLSISLSTAEALGDKGAQAHVLVYFYVREDTQRLYGFASSAEREAFRQLIGVSQIGPKVAMSVLSGISARDLALAVASGDSGRLKGLSGVGPKTAQRLVVELKGKLVVEQLAGDSGSDMGGKITNTAFLNVERDAFDAMIALGYSELQVMRALARVKETVEPGTRVEEWIRHALQVI